MNFSFESIALIFIGLFGIIAAIINRGLYLGYWLFGRILERFGQVPNKKIQRNISVILGSILLLFGLVKLIKLNIA